MLTSKRVPSVLFAVAVLCILLGFALRFPVVGQDADSKKTKVAALQEERRDALKTRVQATEELHKIAKGTLDAVIAAREDLLNAELELATSKAARVDVLKHKVANAKEYETIMKLHKENATASEADVLMAKARRLGVEIELLKAQE